MPSLKVNLKTNIKQRLIREQRWQPYMKLREFLKNTKIHGDNAIHEREAWMVAAYHFPPLDGSPAELLDDPAYADIATKWKTGKFPEPPDFETFKNGFTDFKRMKPAKVEAIQHAEQCKAAPKEWGEIFRVLASQVGAKKANELDVIRWVFENYLTDPREINPDDVPSAGSVGLLMYVQTPGPNYGDFVKANWSKLLPDKKAIEYESRFSDDGRKDLRLLEEFYESLEDEEVPVDDAMDLEDVA